jgi:mono/diheme cytochrome c family protein
MRKNPRLLLLALGLAAVAVGAASAPNARGDTTAAQGRELFVERCSSCHNEKGDKPLRTGPPLSERRLSRERIADTVKGRLSSATAEQQRAVALYIESIVKK